MNLNGIFDAVDVSIESNESSVNYVTLYDGRVTQIKNGICYVNKNGSSVKCYAKNISNISVNNLVHVIEKNNAKTEKDRIILEGYSADSGSISVAWNDIIGKPGTFAPSEHNHEITDINNLSSSLYNKVDVVSGKSLSTNDLTNDLKEKYDSAYSHSTSIHARTDATKTEASTTNGNIKINGTDTTVYTLPSDVAKKTDIPDITSKVDKVSGKGLSTNDLTSALKSNYDSAYTHSTSAHAPTNAEKNTIVGIQKNGTDITVNTTTRKANIIVPTKVSELTNDTGYKTTDNNTLYSLSKSENTIKLIGSDGTTTSVYDENTQYTAGDGINISNNTISINDDITVDTIQSIWDNIIGTTDTNQPIITIGSNPPSYKQENMIYIKTP